MGSESDDRLCWVRFTIRGRSGYPHYAYHLLDKLDLAPKNKANLQDVAESVAHAAGVGQEYGFSWDAERVDALPDTVHAQMRKVQLDAIEGARFMLGRLEATRTLTGCREQGCGAVATQNVHRAVSVSVVVDHPEGPFVESTETPMCDHCAKRNEYRVRDAERLASRLVAQRSTKG